MRDVTGRLTLKGGAAGVKREHVVTLRADDDLAMDTLAAMIGNNMASKQFTTFRFKGNDDRWLLVAVDEIASLTLTPHNPDATEEASDGE